MAASLSNVTTNATKWAGVAKESVMKFSKTAADKATELSSKVSEQAKDGTLMNNVQSGVTNIASTMGKFGTKTWSDVQTFWSGKTQQSNNRNAERLEDHFDISDPVNLLRSFLFHHIPLILFQNDEQIDDDPKTSTALPEPGKSHENLSSRDSDPVFDSWLNETPKTQSTTHQSLPSKQSSTTNPAKSKEQPAPNLINFDDDKWADDDDAGWESIDTK